MALNNKGSGFAFMADPDTKSLFLLAALTVSVEESMETEQSKGFPYHDIGPLQIYDIITTSKETKITVEIEQITENTIAPLMYNQRAGASASLSYPVAKKVTIAPSVTETGLTLDQPVYLTVLSSVSPGQTFFEQVPATPGPAASGEFSVTANTLVFHADDTGKVAGIRYVATTSKIFIGGTNLDSPFENCEIYSQYQLTKSSRRAFWAPRVRMIDKGASLSLGKNDALSRDFQALVDESRGFNHPYVDFPV